MDSLEKVGRVSKPFGLQGELIVNLYDTFPEGFNREEPLFAKIDSLTVPLFLEKFERRGQKGALVKFADFDTDARSQELIGLELFLAVAENEDDSEDDEVYFEDLVGFSVLFEGHSLKGAISAYVDHEHNPLFEVTAEGKEIYVPATEEMISAIDFNKREIEFSLPDGLLDLYI